MRLEIIKRFFTILMLIVCAPFGIYALCVGQASCNILFSFINAFPNKKLLNYSYREQIEDLIPALILSLLMSAAILTINKILSFSNPVQLLFDIFLGIIFYCLFSIISHNKSFLYLLEVIKHKK